MKDLVEINPALAIFPLDLTKMTYEGYLNIYRESARGHPGISGHEVAEPHQFLPTQKEFRDVSDWTGAACSATQLSEKDLAAKLLDMANTAIDEEASEADVLPSQG